MKYRGRRIVTAVAALALAVVWLVINPESYEKVPAAAGDDAGVWNAESEVSAQGAGEGREGPAEGNETNVSLDDGENVGPLAVEVLEKLEVKGRAPKTGYTREEFYSGWPTVEGCNLRQRVIKREFGETAVLDGCMVVAGEYDEPYTGVHKVFTAREEITKGVQIDHVVALSDAWQKGAQYMDKETRRSIATDPLNLLAVDSAANEQKSDGDAATWLPANKRFRCQYVARQVSVKYKYALWVTAAEKTAISNVLASCPGELAVGVE